MIQLEFIHGSTKVTIYICTYVLITFTLPPLAITSHLSALLLGWIVHLMVKSCLLLVVLGALATDTILVTEDATVNK